MAINYLYGRNAILRGTIGDWQGADLRCALLQPASTYQTDNPTTNAGFSALTPLTGSTGKAIASVIVTPNTTRNLIAVTADDPAWTGLTQNEIVAGLLLYLHVTNFNSSIPIFGFVRPVPYTILADGLFTWNWNDDGIAEA